MKPIKLTLTGFAGIKSGLGKDSVVLDLSSVPNEARIIALVGQNGSGKSTLMDNLHPFRLMPSRLKTTTSSVNPNSFSYYDHIGLEASKEFIWEHSGKRFRSLINMVSAGKTQKQEAFLFVQDGDSFKPYTSSKGVTSDGKSAVYDACIEEVLCAPELFFMTQFSAQGKRQIGAMKASEIKDILSVMLGNEYLVSMSQKASEVVKFIKIHIDTVKAQIVELQSQTFVGNVSAKMAQNASDIASAQAKLSSVEAQRKEATLSLGQLQGKLASQASVIARREALIRRIQSTNESTAQAVEKMLTDCTSESSALVTRGIELNQEKNRLVAQRVELVNLFNSVSADFAQLPSLQEDAAKHPAFQQDVSNTRARIETLQRNVEPLQNLQKTVNRLSERIATIKTEGMSLADAIALNTEVSKLMEDVPCKGSDLPSKCGLVKNAHEASINLPILVANRAAKGVEYQTACRERKSSVGSLERLLADDVSLRQEQAKLADLSEKLQKSKQSRESVARIQGLTQTPSSIKKQIDDIDSLIANTTKQIEGNEGASLAISASQQKRINAFKGEQALKVAEIQSELAVMPAIIDSQVLVDAETLVNSLQTSYESNQAALRGLESESEILKRELENANRSKVKADGLQDAVFKLSDASANWQLLSKAFGNDGIIALSIDDAGPAISGIANRLLNDCYGGRFAIRFSTQKATATGILKETFDIHVDDALRGESKSLNDMSGGEKVWINECLVRAFSLYLTQSSGVQYQTLFSDESDGALDANRKREFMRMKRMVLDAGNYEREFMVSQTPELWDLADHIIDVTSL